MSFHRHWLAGVVLAVTACSAADSVAPTDAPSFSKGGSKSASNAAAPRTELRLRLVAPATPVVAGASGHAVFKSRGTEQEFKAEVEHVTPGDQFAVFVDGVQVGGTITAGALGEAEVSVRNRNGVVVPAVQAGTVVEIRTLAGDVVVSGTF